jgi:hypothetical protein
MEKLATEILHKVKKRCRVWQIATFVVLAVAVIEFIAIIF